MNGSILSVAGEGGGGVGPPIGGRRQRAKDGEAWEIPEHFEEKKER